MSGFTVNIEETDKAKVLALIDAAVSNGTITKAIGEGAKAIVVAEEGTHGSFNMSGSNEKSGYCSYSWHFHSDIRDVPTDEEKHMPNEAGYERNPQTGELYTDKAHYHPEWAGQRTNAMAARLGRQPKH